MTACTLNGEFLDMRSRFRRTLLLSAVGHALLLLWLLTAPQPPVRPDEFVTIDWLDPVVAVKPEPVAVPVVESPAPRPRERATEPERITPRPTVKEQVGDPSATAAALAALQPVSRIEGALAVEPQSRSLVPTAAPADLPTAARGHLRSLERGTAPRTEPTVLVRGPSVAGGASTLAVDVPRETAAPAPAGADEAGASRMLDGALLAGPVANRAVRATQLPAYPEWAQRQAVEARVTLLFWVLPDGSIKRNVAIKTSAGLPAFDESATEALRRWRFEPLPAGDLREQWGTITFHFELRD